MAIAPAIMPALSLGLTAAQVGLGVYGSIAGAASEAAAYRDAQITAEKNKKIAKENADRVLMLAQEELMDLGTESAQLIGEQEAIQAGSGLSVDSRSFIQTRAAARQLARIDQLNVQEAANIRAQAYLNEGDAYAAEAAAASRAQGNAGLKGFLGAATSIVSGASNYIKAAPSRTSGVISVPSPVLI